MESKSCTTTLIFLASILTFAWPFYAYFMYVCYRHRHHFVILNRWPKLSFVIVIICILIEILCLIDAVLCTTIFSSISVGLSNAQTGLIYYRAYLIYVRTMRARNYFNTVNRMAIPGDKGFHNCWGKPMLCTVVITSINVIVCRYLGIQYMEYTSFTITTLIGIICMINILHKKVSDSIGITKECIFGISINCLFLALLRVSGVALRSWTPFIPVALWMGIVGVVSSGFAILFIPYNLVRKEAIITHESSGLNIRNPNVLAKSMVQLPALHDPKQVSMWIEKPLSVFLYNKWTNLRLFAGYLSECFALENLLFLERAIILHHMIKRYQNKDVHKKVKGSMEAMDTLNKCNLCCYQLKFVFLAQVYRDIETIIENVTEKDNVDNNGMKYKKGIVEAMKAIYHQFCSRNAYSAINIGYEIRNNLHEMFEEKEDKELMTQFNSYADMLLVFHYAIGECWTMCQTIYHFQFKSYLRRNVLKQDIDDNNTLSEKQNSASLAKQDSLRSVPQLELVTR